MVKLENPYSSGKYAGEYEKYKGMIEDRRWNYKQIAKKEGCCVSRAYRKVRELGLRRVYLKYYPKRRGCKGFDKDVKRQMRSELIRLIGDVPGEAPSQEEIGEHFGYGKERTRQCLHEERLYERWKKMRKGAKWKRRGGEDGS